MSRRGAYGSITFESKIAIKQNNKLFVYLRELLIMRYLSLADNNYKSFEESATLLDASVSESEEQVLACSRLLKYNISELKIYMLRYDMNLKEWLEERQPHLDLRIIVADQICLAVSQLHALGIVHADLKLNNIMLKDERPIIIDFGLSGKSGYSFENLTTPIYSDPDRKGSFPADIYALGIVLLQVITMTILDHKPGKAEIGRLINLIEHEDYRWKIERMLNLNSLRRPSIFDLDGNDSPRRIKINIPCKLAYRATDLPIINWFTGALIKSRAEGPFKASDLATLTFAMIPANDLANCQYYAIAILAIYISVYAGQLSVDNLVDLCPKKNKESFFEKMQHLTQVMERVIANDQFVYALITTNIKHVFYKISEARRTSK